MMTSSSRELVVMGRKALLVVAFTIWSRSIAVKMEMTIMILVCALYAQNWYKPMMSPDVDSMESRTLLMNLVMLVAGLGTFFTSAEDASFLFVYSVFVAMVCSCAAVVLWLLKFIWQHKHELRSRASSSITLKGRLLEGEDLDPSDEYVSFN